MYSVFILLVLGVNFATCGLKNHDEEDLQLTVDTTLQRLAILHRHGDRSPIHTYAKDPYGNETYWPDGWGQLTIKGKRRLYALGKFIRRRYSSFLSDDPGEVKIRSSAANRCLNSVQSLLAGAYPPKGRFVIDPQLTWQPFPVQTMPRPEDSMLNTQSYCPAAFAERERIRQSSEVLDYLKDYRELFQYLSTNTGDEISDLRSAEYLRDCLFIEKSQGWPLPAWATDKVMKELKDITDMSFYFAGFTKKIQRFRTGVFFKDLVAHFDKHARGIQKSHKSRGIGDRKPHERPPKQQNRHEDDDNSGPDKKLFIYSTHDTMVSVLLQALNQFNMLAPPYAATVIFELHKHCFNSSTSMTSCSSNDKTNNFYIKIFYLNETESEVLHQLVPPGCSSTAKCPLNAFSKAVQPLFIDDWEVECSSENYFVTSVEGMCTLEAIDDLNLPLPSLEPLIIPESGDDNEKRDMIMNQEKQESIDSKKSDSKSSVSSCQENKSHDTQVSDNDRQETKNIDKKCFSAKNTERSFRICFHN